MVKRIEKDHLRFWQIVRGKIKSDLQKYITRGELIGKKGKHVVSIPLPQVDIPTFRYGTNQKMGVGQGEGEEGTPIGEKGAAGGSGAGDAPGEHILEVDVPLEELAKILGEKLELPNIQPKGKKSFSTVKDKFTGIRRTGPESLHRFKRTYREALKRQMAMGTYDSKRPVIIPIREDRKYLSWTNKLKPESNAAVIYIMDVSGSMGSEQKEIVRIEAFWIDTWLRSQYRNIECRYLVHDAAAREVDQETFFHLRESGGTKISSAYELCSKVIDENFPSEEWNIYPFHFSDGDNWSGRDTQRCIDLLEKHLLPKCNVFCYGQVKSAYGSGQFKKDLDQHFKEEKNLITSEIPSREGILNSIKNFLGTGK